MSKTTVDISKLLTRLKSMEGGERLAAEVVSSTADEIVLDAKRRAPADLGAIRQNIGKEKKGTSGLKYAIYAAAPESPFQEFGTGGKVEVPAEMASIASTFRGARGGNFAAFILAITGWVARHGMDQSAAYPIARSILRNGIKAQPFLYPAFSAGKASLRRKLEAAIRRLAQNA